QFFENIEAFAAHVHAIIAAVASGDSGHLDDLAGILRSLGVPRGGEPERALFHRLGHQAIHFFLLRRAGRPLLEAADHAFHLLRRDAGGDVDRHAAAPDRVEISGEGFPVGLDAVAFAVLGPIFLEDRSFERRHGLALADDVQGHALAHFALGVAVVDHRLIAVGVHVDVTGRDDVAFGGNRARAGIGMYFADGGDLAVLDADVAVKPGIAGAVDHSAAVDDDIEFGHRILRICGF